MDRITVASSNVESIGYDEAQQILEVEFQNKSKNKSANPVYTYSGVPPQVWHGLLRSPTKGGYLATHIKNVYPSQRVQ